MAGAEQLAVVTVEPDLFPGVFGASAGLEGLSAGDEDIRLEDGPGDLGSLPGTFVGAGEDHFRGDAGVFGHLQGWRGVSGGPLASGTVQSPSCRQGHPLQYHDEAGRSARGYPPHPTLCHTGPLVISPGPNQFEKAAYWSALGAAAAASVSIAGSQILLGISLAAMLAGRVRWRVPGHWPFLAVFAILSLLSMAFSDAPGAGLPQIRKFYVWLMLAAVCSTFRTVEQARWLTGAWLAGGTLSALRGLWQFGMKYQNAQAAGQDFYLHYVGERITGFNSHWMTFSGQLMIALLTGMALLMFGRPEKWMRRALMVCLPVVALALILAFTRGIWIATGAAAVYLLWSWRRWTVAMLPLAAVAALAVGPASLRERATSLVKPHGQADSNLHRVYTFRTGVEMIKAHPWLGLGLERVGPQVEAYIPRDLPKQLPVGYYGHLHNIYIHYAAERGIPAMLAIVLFFAFTLRDWLVRLGSGATEDGWVLRAGVAVVIGVLVTGLFEYNLGDSEVLGMTLASVAMTCACRREDLPSPAVRSS